MLCMLSALAIGTLSSMWPTSTHFHTDEVASCARRASRSASAENASTASTMIVPPQTVPMLGTSFGSTNKKTSKGPTTTSIVLMAATSLEDEPWRTAAESRYWVLGRHTPP